MTRKSPVQMLMDNMNARVNFKYVNIEEWDEIIKELELSEEVFALEIARAYSAGYRHGITLNMKKEQEYTDGSDYYEKKFK